MLFLVRLFAAVDAIAVLVAVYFFFVGLSDGSVSSFNMSLWLVLLGVTGAILIGGIVLNAKGNRGMAAGVLAILAVPALLAGLFLVSVLILQPRWN